MLMLTLRFYATGSILLTAGDFSGVSVATVSRVVKNVSIALAKLCPEFIKMPVTEYELQQTNSMFYKIAQFPKVVGCIDCTHVRIQSPGGENAEIFRNRKGHFSLNVQAVCNANLELIDLVGRWPGSAHDSNIFRNSRLRARLESGECNDCFVLGDTGYGASSYMMTPLSNPQREEEALYNESQIRTRNAIERCFGIWKRRFPILSLGMRVCLDRVMTIIVACGVLHNIARLYNDADPPIEEDVAVEMHYEESVEKSYGNGDANENANIIASTRTSLIRDYFARLTTLQNIRVVLSCLEEENLEYEYMLYQLRDDSYTYDHFDELLQSQEQEKYCLKFQEDWMSIQSRVLQPECSGIIALKGKISSSLLCRKHHFVCFILYDIKKKSHVFTQQYCVPNIIIDPDVVYKPDHQLNFDSSTLYRDLLSITATSFCKHLQIEVKAENFYYSLINFLSNNLGFVARNVMNEGCDGMEVDEFDYETSTLSKQSKQLTSDIFYNNNKSGSYWSGTLLRLQATSKNTISLKIYTNSEVKVLAFVQLLYKDFKEECKILPISCISEVNATKLRHLEDTMRREIQLATKFCKENEKNKDLKRSIVYKFQQELFLRELETDLAAFDIV